MNWLIGAGIAVVVILVCWPLIQKGFAALGIGGGNTGLDQLVSTLSTALQKVEAGVMLSPLGRTSMCGIVIFVGKVVKLLPDGDTKTSCLTAVRTLGDAFVDPNTTGDSTTTTVVSKVS